jgi:inner membrane transporter RhtA
MNENAIGSRTRARITAAPGTVPPAALVIVGMLSVQFGAAMATGLFPALGSSGTVFLRLAFAAVILLAAWRPRVRGYSARDYVLILVFGLVFAAMNSSFYAAIGRVPLGVVVTVEFVGPLSVAVFGSRRLLDLLWAALAAGGIVLLSPLSGVQIDPLGLGLAIAAGVCWAAYILLNVRVGRAFPGGNGLALSMLVGAVLAAPLGIWQGGTHLLDVGVLLTASAVAVLSSVIPYSLELEALRRLPASVFGVLMSAEPAIAAAVGFAVLGQALGEREVLAIALITAASIGATKFHEVAGTPSEVSQITP